MPNFLHILLTLTLLLTLSGCQEWYMPDSNLISDKEFQEKIKGDKLSFKFVKYFTPHCPYCRYLKAVIDKLKHSKEWCFKIYDFNCQWYPQFCMSNVHTGSFPYTAIYNQNGDLHQQIHGFYPEPIISTIFDRIQQKCLSLRTATNSIPPTLQSQPVQQDNQQQTQKHQSQQPKTESLQHDPIATPDSTQQEHQPQTQKHHQTQNKAQDPITPSQPTQHQQQPQKPHSQQAKTQQIKQDPATPHPQQIKQEPQKSKQSHHEEHTKTKELQQNENNANNKAEVIIQKQKEEIIQKPAIKQEVSIQIKEAKLEPSTTVESQPIPETSKNQLQTDGKNKNSSFHHGNYLFYGVCIILAGCYVYNLHKDKQNPQVIQDSYQKSKNHDKHRQVPPPTPKHTNVETSAPSVEQSELLNLPDEAL